KSGAHILPDLEQAPLFQQIRFDKDIADPLNAQSRVTVLPIFVCPSDDGQAIFSVNAYGDAAPYTTPLMDASGEPVQVARSNYVGIFGNPEISPDPGYLLASTDPKRNAMHQGMFFRNSAIRILQVTDGTSNTLFVGERSSNLANVTWTGAVTGGQVPPRNPN